MARADLGIIHSPLYADFKVKFPLSSRVHSPVYALSLFHSTCGACLDSTVHPLCLLNFPSYSHGGEEFHIPPDTNTVDYILAT